MTPAIVRKLAAVLRDSMTTEMQVVYVLAEIRKLLEREGLKYPSLNFHCCWALHAKAKGLGADRILQRFDAAYEYWDNIASAPQEIFTSLSRTLGLLSLKADLTQFLNKLQLPDSLVDNPSEWARFLTLFFSVVEDCPFTLSPKSAVTLRHLRTIQVTTVPTFCSIWTMIEIDGSRKHSFLNLYPTPDGVVGQDLIEQFKLVSAKVRPG